MSSLAWLIDNKAFSKDFNAPFKFPLGSNVDAYEIDNNNPLMIDPLDFTHNLKVICIHAIIIL